MKKLGEIDSTRLLGLKIFMVGFLIAGGGFVIAFLGSVNIGWMIGWAGAVLAIVGIGLHLLLLLRQLVAKKGKASVVDSR